ncbi:MAG: hypothetical protein WDA10_09235 [Porticoccaceae bacterium]|jgi:ABC-type uncharacterized transport system substrate-binding protein|nr:hypothetical protein [Porticoccaceae bacterium]
MTGASGKATNIAAVISGGRLGLAALVGAMALCLLLIPLGARGEGAVTLILSADNDYYRQAAAAFRRTVAATHPEVALAEGRAGDLERLTPAPGELLVALGTGATGKVLARYPDNPVLSLFVTRSAWRDLMATGNPRTAPQGVIFIDQPIARFIHLATLLKPGARTLATVFGPVSALEQPALAAEASRQGLEVISGHLDSDDNPVATLTPLFRGADLFLALPDQGLFNRTVARWALYLGFKHKVPLVGFSRSYTEAGALASLLSSPEDIGREGGEWLDGYLSGRDQAPWREITPRYFTLEINPSVARALGIAIPSEEALYQQLVERLDLDRQP